MRLLFIFLLIFLTKCDLKNSLIESGKRMNPQRFEVSSNRPFISDKRRTKIGKIKCKQFGYSRFDTLRVYEITCLKQAESGCKIYKISYIVDCH